MKKLALILSMMVIFIAGFVNTALADAADYDIQVAEYYVYVLTPDGGLNMRYGPGVDYEKVTENRIPDGTRLFIELVSDTWGYTSYNGNSGWVALKQTTKNPPVIKTQAPAPVSTPVPTQNPITAEPTIAPAETVQITPAPVQQTVSPQSETPSSSDTALAKSALRSQFILIAILVLFVIIIALLLVIITNMNSKK